MTNRYFPPEIFAQILSYPATPVELASLASVSRLFHTFVEPLLYENVTVKFHEDSKLKHYITRSSAVLLELIRSHPETGRHVRSLSFRSARQCRPKDRQASVELHTLAEEVCRWATNISSLDIGESGMDSLDDVYSGPHGESLQEITMNLINTEDVDILKILPNLRTLRLTYLNDEYPTWEDEEYSAPISLHLETLDLSRCAGNSGESLRWIIESSIPSLRNFSIHAKTLQSNGFDNATLGKLNLHQFNIHGGFSRYDRFSETIFDDDLLEQMRFEFLTITSDGDDYGRWTAYYDARDHEDAHLVRFDYGDTIFIDDFARYLETGTHRLKQIGVPQEAQSNEYRTKALEALCAIDQIEILSLPDDSATRRTFSPLSLHSCHRPEAESVSSVCTATPIM